MIPILILLLLTPLKSTVATAGGGAYEVLAQHGLPRGLLPKGITEFSFTNGSRFEAHLAAGCTAKFETEVHYEANISGTITYGKMSYLSGISAQELFLWFPVRGIAVEDPRSGLINFDVGGVVHKQYALSLFENPPDCDPSSPVPAKEGSNLARLVYKSKNGKLRYKLDQGENGGFAVGGVASAAAL